MRARPMGWAREAGWGWSWRAPSAGADVAVWTPWGRRWRGTGWGSGMPDGSGRPGGGQGGRVGAGQPNGGQGGRGRSVDPVALAGQLEAAHLAPPGQDDGLGALAVLEHLPGAFGAREGVDPAHVGLRAAVLPLAPVDLLDRAQQRGHHVDPGAHRLIGVHIRDVQLHSPAELT